MLLFEYRDFMNIHDYLIYKLDRKRVLSYDIIYIIWVIYYDSPDMSYLEIRLSALFIKSLQWK